MPKLLSLGLFTAILSRLDVLGSCRQLFPSSDSFPFLLLLEKDEFATSWLERKSLVESCYDSWGGMLLGQNVKTVDHASAADLETAFGHT